MSLVQDAPRAAAAVVVDAPAKINLALHVCGRRDDGYHLLDSLVVFAGIGDIVRAEPAETLTLALAGPFARALKHEPNNLVLRAARMLAQKVQVPCGVRLTLEKNLPVASGMGGGSSDAAAALLACAQLWTVDVGNLTTADLASLGADVPVCMRRVPALMRGIGEEIAAIDALPPAWLVLANPGVGLSTKDVFAALRGRFSAALDPLPAFGDAAGLAAYLKVQRNDLTVPALGLRPVIGSVIRRLERAQGCLLARLSGSGPTCFGLFADEDTARAAAAAIATAQPKWWVRAAPMHTTKPCGLKALKAAPALA